ncbi:MAG: hypothetical protein GF334_00675 [Candidatus Altiarchaeales archaeon]|nr:hypothetical protein [Candidatus Altiarchaeales archaeon]
MEIRLFHPYINERAIENSVQVLRSRWIGQGPMSTAFEKKAGEILHCNNPVLVSSGTVALHLALILAGVGPGDEVITTAMTCTATNHPILQCGAKPVFADIQYETGNIDPHDIYHRITSKTKAIMCVHWAGYPCDMSELVQVAEIAGIPIIQDGAHAQGATYKGQPIAAWSEYFMTSFQAIKTITSVEGGLLNCPNEDKAERAQRLRWFAIDRENRTPAPDGYYDHRDIDETGYKYQPNDVFSAIGLGNIQDFHRLLNDRRLMASYYHSELADVSGVTLFDKQLDRASGHWLFTIHVERRDDFIAAMASRGVEAGVIHRRNDIYGAFGGRRDDLPNLDEFEKTYVSIPIGNHLKIYEVEYVIDAIEKGW